MRKSLSVCLAVMLLTVLTGAAPPVNAAEDIPAAFYLIDEIFSITQGNRPGGWDLKSAGGGFKSVYCDSFKIIDNTNLLPVSMTRKIRPQSEGILTLEYGFSFDRSMDYVSWQLREGKRAGVSIIVENGNLYLETSGEKKPLSPISLKTPYRVKAVIDLDNRKTDVFVNGALKAQAADFKENISSIDNFDVSTGVEAVGEMFFGPVKLYKGYIVNERLLSVTAGQFPSDWTAHEGGGKVRVAEIFASTKPDIYSFVLEDTSSSDGVSVSKSFAHQSGALTFEYKMFFADKTDGVAAEIYSDAGAVFRLVTAGGKLCYVKPDGRAAPFYDYIKNLWYTVRVLINPEDMTADIYLNGKRLIEGAGLLVGADGINRVSFSTGKAEKGVIWLDDIILYKTSPLPADYVPEPQKASSANHILGIQSCSLWREGHHIGWDHITGYPERKPYLGYYDEGSAEVADWEIKFLVEHGIDFQFFCWFRPRGGEDNSVKDPYQQSALHDGYFYAQYSDLMNFAIMWENGNSYCSGSEDFRKNLVPYWIEYYFKDPRYLKIDNKPVFSLFSFSGLKRDFGDSTEKIKAETDYLRKAAREAGFDDVIMLSTYNGSDRNEMETMKAAGIDYIFSYSWGYSSGLVGTQIAAMEKQHNAGGINIIPSLGMGRNDDPWGRGNGMGTFAGLEDWEMLNSWARDKFMPAQPEGSLGRQMVLFDNWNEYGEGHFIMPANLHGFGYLDGIRKVFAPGGEHEDARPTAAQLERITRLFPQDRYTPPKVGGALPPVPDTVIKGWYFEEDGDYEKWTPIQQVKNLMVEGGAMSGASLGVNPVIVNNENLFLDIDDAPYLRVTMKSSAPSAKVKIYFITESDPVWEENKHLEYYTEADTKDYHTYHVYTQGNIKWQGKLKQLRIDPINTNGDFAIDSIEVLANPNPGIRVFIDGVRQRYDQPPVIRNGRTLAPLRAVFESLGMAVDWDGETGEITAYKSGKVIRLTIGESKAFVNNKEVLLDQSPVIINDRTYVPLRFIAEALGAEVEWDGQSEAVYINFPTDEGGDDGAPKGKNLIPDPGMEISRFPGGTWQAEATYVKDQAHSGKQALKVKALQQYGSIHYLVDIKPGREYYYSGWARLAPDAKGTVVQVILQYTLDSGNREQKIVLTSPKLNPNGWTQFSGRYMIDKLETAENTQIAIFLDIPSGTDTFYLDDLEIFELE